MRGQRQRCHGVLGRQCQVTQKKTREAKRQETREEWVEQRSRKGNWGDKGSQERRSGDERYEGEVGRRRMQRYRIRDKGGGDES